MRLNDQVIVMTGASRGLGKAMASAFVSEGGTVVCASRTETRLSNAVEEIAEGPGEAKAVPTDVRSQEDVASLVRQALDDYGRIDVWVNNAGIMQRHATGSLERKPIVEIPVHAWDMILDTNLRGVFLCTREVVPEMLSRDGGRVIHISSGHGLEGRSLRGAYVASKFGLEGFHETLALELAGTDVDSVSLRPPRGGVYTESSGEHGRDKADYRHESPDVIAEASVAIAAGAGENGGRYIATEDGEGYVAYDGK